jgi:hypothetical protein
MDMNSNLSGDFKHHVWPECGRLRGQRLYPLAPRVHRVQVEAGVGDGVDRVGDK